MHVASLPQIGRSVGRYLSPASSTRCSTIRNLMCSNLTRSEHQYSNRAATAPVVRSKLNLVKSGNELSLRVEKEEREEGDVIIT